MDRLLIKDFKNNEFSIGGELTSKSFIIDCEKSPDSFVVSLVNNVRANILIINIKNNNEIKFVLKEYASLHLSILGKEKVENLRIKADLEKYAEIDACFADFLIDQNKSEITINLNGEEAACAWHLASLATKKDKKSFDVSVYTAFENGVDIYVDTGDADFNEYFGTDPNVDYVNFDFFPNLFFQHFKRQYKRFQMSFSIKCSEISKVQIIIIHNII